MGLPCQLWDGVGTDMIALVILSVWCHSSCSLVVAILMGSPEVPPSSPLPSLSQDLFILDHLVFFLVGKGKKGYFLLHSKYPIGALLELFTAEISPSLGSFKVIAEQDCCTVRFCLHLHPKLACL